MEMGRVLFFLIFFLLYINVYGQTKMYEAVVVTVSNDTIEGFISYSRMKQSPNKISFFLKQDDLSEAINSDKIISFKFQDSENQFIFKTFEIEKLERRGYTQYTNLTDYAKRQKVLKPKSAFIKQITKGEINLYEFIDDDNELHLLVEYEGKIEALVFHEVKLIGGIIKGLNQYEMQLKRILYKTCIDFSDNYFSKYKYNVTDIKSLINEYNRCFSTPRKPKNEVIQKPKENNLTVIKDEQSSHLNTEITKVGEQNSVKDKNKNIIFFADKDSLELGTSTFINWDIPYEDRVVLSYSSDNTNFEIISNSYFRKGKHRVTPKVTTYYKITSNTIEKLIKVNVKLPIIKKPLIEYFYFEKDEIKLGESTVLKWSVFNTKKVVLENSVNGLNWSVEENEVYSNMGEKIITPKKDVFYRLVADDATITLKLTVVK